MKETCASQTTKATEDNRARRLSKWLSDDRGNNHFVLTICLNFKASHTLIYIATF